jgi:uncharacterized protein (DUF305 family)
MNSKSNSRTTPLLALAAVAVLGVATAGCGGEDEQSAGGNPTEQAFLEAMVPHHEAAIAMADVAERRAQSSEIRRLASDIGATQRPEIAEMRSIHERLFGSPLAPNEAAHEKLGLTAEEAGVDHEDAAATLARAKPFDRAFVDEMVPHHQGAIAMAEVLLPATDDAELRHLAEGIIATQEREIREMDAFREERYGAPVPGSGADGAAGHPEAPAGEHEGGH